MLAKGATVAEAGSGQGVRRPRYHLTAAEYFLVYTGVLTAVALTYAMATGMRVDSLIVQITRVVARLSA